MVKIMKVGHDDIYVKPYVVNSLSDCAFYHYMDIPGDGLVTGKWDIRDGVDKYLGNVDFNGKRVLELGTASGFLCFEMEKRGAEVISHDIGENDEWDMVPYAQYDYKENIREFKYYCKRMKNAYWYAHKAYRSKAKVVYGSIYNVPEEIGNVDIATFCSVLLHLQNPFKALQKNLPLVKDTVIITDLAPQHRFIISPLYYARCFIRHVLSRGKASFDNTFPYMEFLPDYKTIEHKDAWWSLSPEIIVRFIELLGFEKTKITYHYQKLYGKKVKLFTVVGRRFKS